MRLNRRDFFTTAALTALAASAPTAASAKSAAEGLKPMTGGIRKIAAGERQARILKAQTLMRQNNLSALVIEPGASLVYFTGVEWWRSERPTLAILPVEGDPCIVTPFFEEASVRESLAIPAEVRVWQEDENPFVIAAGFLKDRKQGGGRIGMEETVRYFIADGLANVLPHATILMGATIARGCRTTKSPAEIALMQMAADITIAAYRHTWTRIERGMTPGGIADIMMAAMAALGGTPGFSLILLGEASAYPHGSSKPQTVREGEIVLMDCGCSVEGYQSDISRTFVFGEANAAQRKVWSQVHRGQEIALSAATLGAPAGGVDDAVRLYYESLGYGPRYKLPGLSHRTGHGIGLDGHEPVNLVHGEMTPLSAGMCFSNEPGIYIPGAFGVRLEDCFHLTENGPKWFSTPPPSIERPFD